MLLPQLLHPKSLVVVGGSLNGATPGGRILQNICENNYNGQVYVVNPKWEITPTPTPIEEKITLFKQAGDLPVGIDLAIIAVSYKFVKEIVETLANQKMVKAFIILSAGFSEMGDEGKLLENEIVAIIKKQHGVLIGPNCIGVLTPTYAGIFAGPVPKLAANGCDFVSGSGATAAFIIEKGIPMGLTFSSLFSVGNSAHVGVEDVLEHWDQSYQSGHSADVKLIYVENIKDPARFLKHARNLVNKGCDIAAVKAGASNAGARAASSHTGAMASNDVAVSALFKKAGIIRCQGREELLLTAALLQQGRGKRTGKRLAIITHAGGPGVMLTDILSQNGLEVPALTGPHADALLAQLYPGSSVANPIDFLATGTAEQLGLIIDLIDKNFDEIDAIAVIFGTPGLFDVTPVYRLLSDKMKSCSKAIYPILPSITTAATAVANFQALGHVWFSDEVSMGRALAHVHQRPGPFPTPQKSELTVDIQKIRTVIAQQTEGYISPNACGALMDAVGIRRVLEATCTHANDAVATFKNWNQRPVVMKVVGPVHKSDSGGVRLNVKSESEIFHHYQELMQIEQATGVLMQEMISADQELFIGAKRDPLFGHILLCGLGGIFIEVFHDTAAAITPLDQKEALQMIRSLKGYSLFKGVRGRLPLCEQKFAQVILQLSALLTHAPEIEELDFNPILARGDQFVAVDARIKIGKGAPTMNH